MEEEQTVKKKTDTEYPILEMLKNRWSPRVFSDENNFRKNIDDITRGR